MSASNAFETALLQLILQNVAIANVGDAAGLQPSSAAGDVFISLHTADPGEAGNQGNSEVAYTGYARVAVDRDAAEWGVANGQATNENAVTFPLATGGTATATHFGVGTLVSGAGMLLLSGPLDASLAISNGIQPTFDPGELVLTCD